MQLSLTRLRKSFYSLALFSFQYYLLLSLLSGVGVMLVALAEKHPCPWGLVVNTVT